MLVPGPRRTRGASHVEYAIIIGALSLMIVATVAALGGNVGAALCSAPKVFGVGESCSQRLVDNGGGDGGAASAVPSTNPSASSVVQGIGTGSGGGGVIDLGTAGPSATPSTSTTPSPSASASDSPGTQVFNSATIDQSSITADLSARFNVGWYPTSWNDVTYPQTATVDVTWSPALEIDQLRLGTDGTWTYTTVAPGHLLITRTGTMDTSGFQPEPEILLKKPATTQTVSATFTISTPNTPGISRTASTTAVAYR